MNIQTITAAIEAIPSRQSFLSIACDLRDFFQEEANKLSIFNEDTVIEDINILINILVNLRTIIKAAATSDKLHSAFTPSEQ